MLKPFLDPHLTEAGCDEAGRGCLAGPVFAAAVILPKEFSLPLLNDSKKLSPAQRFALRPLIEQEARAWGVAYCDHHEIDSINILNASILAMHRAVDKLAVRPRLLLIDGNRFKPYPGVPHQCFVKGDASYAAIAAASILAKVYRDEYMDRIHEEHPLYNWRKNKAYATREHREAILRFGYSPYHRRSFHIAEEQMKMEF
jgi:ribonuclease HII